MGYRSALAIPLLLLAAPANAGVMMMGGGVPATAASAGLIGQSTSTACTPTFSGGVNYSTFTTTTAGTVGYGHVKVSAADGETICVKIYDASLALLAYGTVAITGDGDQWANVTLNTPVALVAATSYNLAIGNAGDWNWNYCKNTGGDVYACTTLACSTSDTCSLQSPIQADSTPIEGDSITIVFNNAAGDP